MDAPKRGEPDWAVPGTCRDPEGGFSFWADYEKWQSRGVKGAGTYASSAAARGRTSLIASSTFAGWPTGLGRFATAALAIKGRRLPASTRDHGETIVAPLFSLARAAWIPTLVIWHADDRFTRFEGAPCADYAAALAASWRLRPA